VTCVFVSHWGHLDVALFWQLNEALSLPTDNVERGKLTSGVRETMRFLFVYHYYDYYLVRETITYLVPCHGSLHSLCREGVHLRMHV
jgi:hypothetical protein